MRLVKTAFAEREGITVPILNSWIYRYGLPVLQIGRRTYIDENDFEIWLTEHKKVLAQKPERSQEIAIPKQCRKSSIAGKMRKIY